MRATSSQIGEPNSEPCLLKVTRQPGLAVPDRELDLILNLLRHLNMSEISSWQINSSRTVTETHWFSRFKAFICSEERRMWQDFAMKDCCWLETSPDKNWAEVRPSGGNSLWHERQCFATNKKGSCEEEMKDTRSHNHVLSCRTRHSPATQTSFSSKIGPRPPDSPAR